ncbi:addiction module protein [Methylovulum psychrotolerans]|uniref:addiction module protein n=1 Tax=Methylovulum psychrotolerans TaxID=1704499 RepID=UPI001BFFAEB5|nr:addiction module protein [Methylovulum psychrotolerans]MBT9096219.1 addiction module protein [Methylovulum psychrotolerans]
MNTQLLKQATALNIDEQLELVEAIWDNIASHDAAPALTAAQKAELDNRLADYLANPDVMLWSEVKAAALARLEQDCSNRASAVRGAVMLEK